ncbi:hypothetical protein T492DRAFT_1044592 [Pavlovales sp. CCMP2436]|nr:hypothetical protein T492DRAFT_1044592 [Pavlovales sp. CCMP2436]
MPTFSKRGLASSSAILFFCGTILCFLASNDQQQLLSSDARRELSEVAEPADVKTHEAAEPVNTKTHDDRSKGNLQSAVKRRKDPVPEEADLEPADVKTNDDASRGKKTTEPVYLVALNPPHIPRSPCHACEADSVNTEDEAA